MAEAIGIKWNAWARYERGEVSPGAEILRQICIAHACSADWLLGLPARGGGGGNATASGAGSVAVSAGSHARVQTGGDCSKCKLMQAHLREITGRG